MLTIDQATMTLNEAPKRLELQPDELECVSAALAFAVIHTDLVKECVEGFSVGKPVFHRIAVRAEGLARQRRLLVWKPCMVEGVMAGCDALLGTERDGARFHLEYRASCYRRGKWNLMIDVLPGEHHHTWGCFDEADQPMRNYHDLGNALAEAEAIAAVLLADRTERGPIEGWTPSGQG